MWSRKSAHSQSVWWTCNERHTNTGRKVAKPYTAMTEQNNDSNVHLHFKVNQDYISVSSSFAYFISVKLTNSVVVKAFICSLCHLYVSLASDADH